MCGNKMCHRHLIECAHMQFRSVQNIPIHSSPAIREVNVFQMDQTLQDYLFHKHARSNNEDKLAYQSW